MRDQSKTVVKEGITMVQSLSRDQDGRRVGRKGYSREYQGRWGKDKRREFDNRGDGRFSSMDDGRYSRSDR